MSKDGSSDPATLLISLVGAVPVDRLIAIHLAGGHLLIGRANMLEGGWLRLRTRDSERLVNLAHVVFIDLGDGIEDEEGVSDEALPKPRSKDTMRKVGSRAPGRPWSDTDLKALSEGFLDAIIDTDLAMRHHRTKMQIRELRQAFECQRGNAVEEQISPTARLWIDRWRRVLAKG